MGQTIYQHTPVLDVVQNMILVLHSTCILLKADHISITANTNVIIPAVNTDIERSDHTKVE